ncbi:MAG: hypothetical protein CMJ25_15765 [Phycisphaerae bacterium]|nr:hypothetical protein [Phycisphaerae bacterium]|tara:strand:- start:106 stop:945 length:840 start_codon:yes stop_codon:yes gene_type:complete
MSFKSSASGVNMDKLKHNFKNYQYKGSDTNPDREPPSQSSAQDFKSSYQDNLQKYIKSSSNKTKTTNNNTDYDIPHPFRSQSNSSKITNNNTNYDIPHPLRSQSNSTKITNNNTDNDIQQNVGNKEDMITNIGNQNSIKNSTIGNDYSVNISGVGMGENGGSSSAFNNMQSLAAYQALNNNQFQRSKSELDGTTRADQAIDQGNKATGAYQRAANIYNSMGDSQNYWSKKADAQQNFYLGDIFKMKAPEFKGGGVNPSDPMAGDKTESIYKDFRDSIGN